MKLGPSNESNLEEVVIFPSSHSGSPSLAFSRLSQSLVTAGIPEVGYLPESERVSVLTLLIEPESLPASGHKRSKENPSAFEGPQLSEIEPNLQPQAEIQEKQMTIFRRRAHQYIPKIIGAAFHPPVLVRSASRPFLSKDPFPTKYDCWSPDSMAFSSSPGVCWCVHKATHET